MNEKRQNMRPASTQSRTTPLRKRHFSRHPLAIALCASIGLTGCMEWDNSDDYKDDSVDTELQGPSGGYDSGQPPASENDEPPATTSAFVGYLEIEDNGAFGVAPASKAVNAEVCYDINDNQNCDAEEDSTKTDANGEYSIKVAQGTTKGKVILRATKGKTTFGSGGLFVAQSFAKVVEHEVGVSQATIMTAGAAGNLKIAEGIVNTPNGKLGNANVCADLNANGACDAGEPSVTTDEHGRYEMTLPGSMDSTNTEVIVTTKPGVTTVGDTGETVMTEEAYTGNVDVGTNLDQTIAVPAPEYTYTPKPDTGGNVSGQVIGYEGYLSGAEVCADLNFDGQCGPDEPTTVTGTDGTYELIEPNGNFQIVAKAIANDTVNEGSGETVKTSYTLVGPHDPHSMEQIVSPVTDRVADEMASMVSPDLDDAKDLVAENLGTSNDPLSNYIEDQNSSDTLKADNAERLERVVDTIGELIANINDTITDADRQESGLSDAEIEQVVQDQISNAVPDILDDVNDSLASNDPYDPAAVINDPKYDPITQRPDLAPVTADLTELQSRIANKTPETDLFYQSGYERFADPNEETVLVRVYPHPRAPGKFYYEAVRRITTSIDKDQATVNSYLAVPRYNQALSLYSYTQSDNGYWCAETSEYGFNCTFLNLDPTPFTVEAWAGSVWRTNTLRRGMNAEVLMIEGFNEGEVIVTSTNNGLSALEEVGKFELDGLGGVEVVRTLLGDQMPGVDFSSTSAGAFSVESAAWTLRATLNGKIHASLWPSPGAGTACSAPGSPEVMEVVSCNLVYGEQPGNRPAQTYDDLLYPEGSLGQAYTGTLSGQYATGAIPIDGPGADPYVMRLYGDIANLTGPVQVDRKHPDGSWETVSTGGKWTYETDSFPYISVNLPDAYSMKSLASGSFEAGQGILYERFGYMRHGWMTPTDISPEQLFGRPAHQFLVNAEALSDLHSALGQMGLLEVHPYFWDEYQFYLEN